MSQGNWYADGGTTQAGNYFGGRVVEPSVPELKGNSALNMVHGTVP